MINEFMANGRLIVYTEGKAFPRNDVCKQDRNLPGCPIVVLTDEFSGSTQWDLAGAIQDGDRGLIIGRRTLGKGLVSISDSAEWRIGFALPSPLLYPFGKMYTKDYELGKTDEYDQDLFNRFMHGEFDWQDSIKINNSLKYQTSLGRTVYGGGGIMPDIFIPRDTSGSHLLLQQCDKFRRIESLYIGIFW